MMETNPFDASDHEDAGERQLVARAKAGDRDALEEFVVRHQRWIYNIAIRMLAHPADAEDATQEILIKAITRLAAFEGRSTVRTWLYRIVVNHVLNMRRGRLERPMTFGEYGRGLDDTPDLDLSDSAAGPDVRLLVDEARIGCTTAMLLCLDREQRLIYVLGEILGVTDVVGSELLDTSPDNFRQRLARARRDLHSFMNDKCGLVNQANPCRCARKTAGFIRCGHVDPANLLFAQDRVRQVREVAPSTADALATLDARYADVFRQHPFYESRDLVPMLRRLLETPEWRRATDLP
jgi:RNA polymerase sigma factor (sigma-70 family)